MSFPVLIPLLRRILNVKVQDLEHKWRSQSAKCNVLSKELEKFHLESDTAEFTASDLQRSPNKALCNFLNDLHSHTGKGKQSIFKITIAFTLSSLQHN